MRMEDEEKTRVLEKMKSKAIISIDDEVPTFMVYQAILGGDDRGFFIEPNEAEKSILRFDPNAKKTKDAYSNLNPPAGEYSVVPRPVYCDVFILKPKAGEKRVSKSSSKLKPNEIRVLKNG
jgi:hypothetical protein